MKILILLVTLCFLIGCNGSRNKDIGVSVALSIELSHLDPARTYDLSHNQVNYQVYETLLEYEPETNNLRPLLAKGFPSLEHEGRILRFQIRPGVQYHPHPKIPKGRTVKAQDFITSIKRVAFSGTQSQGWWMLEGKIVGLDEFRAESKNNWNDFLHKNVDGLKILGEYEFEIHLIKPSKEILYFFAMAFSAPMPLEFIQEDPNILLDQEIGTGPYMVSYWQPKGRVELTRFPDYSIKLESLAPKILFQVMPEDSTRWLNFKKKKIDFLEIPKDSFGQAFDDQGKLRHSFKELGIQFLKTPSLTYWWLSFNMQKAPWGKNKYLRQAIFHAIDRDKYIQLFTHGHGLKANHILPPSIAGYTAIQEKGFDLQKAKNLLVKAGYPEGKGLPLLTFDTRGNSSARRQQAEYIKMQLEKIGIQVEIRLNSFAQFMKEVKKGSLTFWQGGWIMDYPVAENTLQLLYGPNIYPGPNKTGYQNSDYDRYYEKLQTLSLEQRKERFEIIQKMNDIIHEEKPWIMLYYAQNMILTHDKIQNLHYSELVNNFFKYIHMK